jgi:hypothetical protein
MHRNYIMILTHDGEFVDYGYINGLEMVQSRYSNHWFPSLKLLTVGGNNLEGWRHMVRPHTPQLQLEHEQLCQLDL